MDFGYRKELNTANTGPDTLMCLLFTTPTTHTSGGLI